MSLIELKNITKIYKDGTRDFFALNDINLNIEKGDMIAVMGPSGSGKSTLLNIIGCMDSASKGKYVLDKNEINKIDKSKLWKTRGRYIGFIFQYFALIKEYSVIDNVILPLAYANVPSSKRKTMAREVLKNVGLEGYDKKRPSMLSGGQQQRVAIARAIVNKPDIILADEPTGALDQETGKEIMELLVKINKEENNTIIIVTHDKNIASYCHKVINIKDGKIIENTNIECKI